MNTAPKGPLQCKRCLRNRHTRRNCVYAPRCVACGDSYSSGTCATSEKHLDCCRCGVTTLPSIVAAVTGKRRMRPLQKEREGSAANRMAPPRACQRPKQPQLSLSPNRKSWAQAAITWLESAASSRLSSRQNPTPPHLAQAGGPGGWKPQWAASTNPVVPRHRWWILNQTSPSTLTYHTPNHRDTFRSRGWPITSVPFIPVPAYS
jgi:hypothetical protein